MRKLIAWVLMVTLFLTPAMGCAPKEFVPFNPPVVEFEKTPPYEGIDFDAIPKPKPIVPVYVDENFKEVPIEEAKFVLLVPKEYAKVAAVVKLAKTYKQLALQQEVLINNQVNIINSLKEYVALEQMKSQQYRQLWADSENAYRQERYQHKLDNAINKGVFGAIAAAVLIAIIAM
jgi:hypothetical protein